MNNFKEINSLQVYKNTTLAGVLQRTQQGCEFQLVRSFIDDKTLKYFSYLIAKTNAKTVIQGDNLPAFFAGLLPEGRRLNSLVKKFKTSDDDLFTLLAAVGKDCIGDIYVDNGTIREIKNTPNLKEVNFYTYFETLLDPQTTLLDNQALAGVQEKISESMISFPLNVAKKNKAYILKLNPIDKANLIQNELTCLNLAKKCGFSVAFAKIIVDKDNNSGLLVERFDRLDGERLHQEDACQFLNRYPADKYRITMNEIADSLVHLTAAPQIEILNLLLQYAFSYLIGNGDLHAKNISLQTLEDGTITLTPLYDLICTAIYGDYKMALKIDGRDDNIKRKTFINFAERYNIPAKAINSALDILLKRFITYYQCLSLINMSEKKKRLLQNMITKRIGDLKV